MSTKLFTLYLQEKGINAALLPALEFMRTNDEGEPDLGQISSLLEANLAEFENVSLFITQGYTCKNYKG